MNTIEDEVKRLCETMEWICRNGVVMMMEDATSVRACIMKEGAPSQERFEIECFLVEKE